MTRGRGQRSIRNQLDNSFSPPSASAAKKPDATAQRAMGAVAREARVVAASLSFRPRSDVRLEIAHWATVGSRVEDEWLLARSRNCRRTTAPTATGACTARRERGAPLCRGSHRRRGHRAAPRVCGRGPFARYGVELRTDPGLGSRRPRAQATDGGRRPRATAHLRSTMRSLRPEHPVSYCSTCQSRNDSTRDWRRIRA